MSPALLLNSCSFETMHLYADLCTVQLLWANWVQSTLQRQQQGGGKPKWVCHQTKLSTWPLGLVLHDRLGKAQGLCTGHWVTSTSLSPCCQNRTAPLSAEPSQTRSAGEAAGPEAPKTLVWHRWEREAQSLKTVNGLQKPPGDQIWATCSGDLHVGGRVDGSTSKVSNYTLQAVL